MGFQRFRAHDHLAHQAFDGGHASRSRCMSSSFGPLNCSSIPDALRSATIVTQASRPLLFAV
eukprot:m.80388 g.80388  ORF g.80388 m.80388 type:complete len:62 (+) comp14207_c1_seq1:788-973(+)